MRNPLSVQLALLIALLGSLAAVFFPAFLRNLHASRLVEPLDGLRHLSAHATMQAAGAPIELAYPDTVARTPGQIPAGEPTMDAPGTWNHPTWRFLNFKKTEPHYFSFEFESEKSSDGAHFYARSFGDLDGDGQLSEFEVFGETRRGGEPTTYHVRMSREVE